MLNWFKKKNSHANNGNGPDFGAVDSMPKAVKLFKKGQLSKLHLMPLEFGGEDSDMNTLYTPDIVVELKARFDGMIEQMLIDGKNLSYSAKPEYKGKSVIPSTLEISVTGDSEFSETINIW